MYITLHPRQKQGQNAIAHACGWICRWWDTYITPQSCQDCYRVYHASFNAKTRAKRHCACVWTGLQMVGHVYRTTIMLIVLSCILRFIRGKKTKTKRHCACVWTGLQMVGHIYHTTIVPRLLSCISRFVQCKNKGKTPLRMRVDGFADGGTRISNHNHANRAIMYITLHPRQKQRQKRHCACVWMDLQMVGHVYHTTIVPRLLSCISRFIQGKNKGKTPLRMRVDGFADGGTHISNHNRAKTDHLYIRTKNKDKCPCACVWTGLQMVGHIYRTTIVLIVLSCILSAAKTRAKRHCACVWTGLQMVGHIYHTTLVLACLCLFSEKAIVCLSDIPRTLVITYSTFCIY